MSIALDARRHWSRPWTGGRSATMPEGIGGISIDTRSLQPGDAFFAIKGETMDGHDFASAAIKAGAGVLVVAEGKAAGARPGDGADDRRAGCAGGAGKGRRCGARALAGEDHRGDRLGRQDQHQGSAAPRAAAVGKVHASAESFNNHWGVPLTLARMPADCDYARLRDRHEPSRRNPAAGQDGPAACRHRHADRRRHISASSDNLDEIAKAKAEIFEGMEPERRGAAQPRRSALEAAGQDGARRRRRAFFGFGEHARSTFRLTKCELHADHSVDHRQDRRREVAASIGAPGRHMVQNVLAVLGAAHLVGADVDQGCAGAGRPFGRTRSWQAPYAAPSRRGRHADRRKLQRQPGLDAGGDGAARRDAGAGRRPPDRRAWRHAGTRRAIRRSCMPALADLIAGTSTDMVFLAGPEMKASGRALPDASRRSTGPARRN